MESSSDMPDIVNCLIDSIDDSQHNDVTIMLEDGGISASKLILSQRSEYFRVMFSKNNRFKEEKESCVKLTTTKIIMTNILEVIYGGTIEISKFNCLQMLEFLNMLRLLCLFKSFAHYDNLLKKALQHRKYHLKECFKALQEAYELKLEKATNYIVMILASKMDVCVNEYPEEIMNLSEEAILLILEYIYKIERRHKLPFPSSMQMKKFNFIFKWLQKNENTMRMEKAIFKYSTTSQENECIKIKRSNNISFF